MVMTVAPGAATGCKFYVDGVELQTSLGVCPTLTSLTSVRRLGSLMSPATCATPSSCNVKAAATPFNSYFDYKGLMDEVMFFEKELSLPEVQSLYTYFNNRRPRA